MDETPAINRWLAWCLASFHTVIFILGLVLFLYLSADLGSLLANLNTLAGYGLFGALWMATWWSTSRALRGIRWEALEFPAYFGKLLTPGVFWGAANGLLFLLALIVLLELNVIVSVLAGTASADALVAPLVYAIFGSVVAAILGGLVGVVLAILDSLLLAVARSIYSASLSTDHISEEE